MINSMVIRINTRVLTAHVPSSLAEQVEKMAFRLERSRGWIIKEALTLWLNQEEERYHLTLNALEDVKVGRVVEHSIVQAWANSLSTDKRLSLPKHKNK
jgi:predicted transcriptional regulator